MGDSLFEARCGTQAEVTWRMTLALERQALPKLESRWLQRWWPTTTKTSIVWHRDHKWRRGRSVYALVGGRCCADVDVVSTGPLEVSRRGREHADVTS